MSGILHSEEISEAFGAIIGIGEHSGKGEYSHYYHEYVLPESRQELVVGIECDGQSFNSFTCDMVIVSHENGDGCEGAYESRVNGRA